MINVILPKLDYRCSINLIIDYRCSIKLFFSVEDLYCEVYKVNGSNDRCELRLEPTRGLDLSYKMVLRGAGPNDQCHITEVGVWDPLRARV